MMKRTRRYKYNPEDSVTELSCKCCSFQTRDVQSLDDHIHSNHEEEPSRKNIVMKTVIKSEAEEDEVEVEILFGDEGSSSTSTEAKKKFEEGNVDQYYKCSLCDYSSINKKDVSKHLFVHNSEVRPKTTYRTLKNKNEIYKCSHCPYETRRKTDMPKHLLVHCANPPMYQCSQCQYQTKRKNDLPKHLLCHKSADSVPVFRCTYLNCDYFTKRRGDLSKHVLNHQERELLNMFRCSECRYITKRKNDLHKHTLVHSDRSLTGIIKCLKCTYATEKVHKFSKHVLSKCQVWDDSINMEHLVLEEVLENADKEGAHVVLEMDDEHEYAEYEEIEDGYVDVPCAEAEIEKMYEICEEEEVVEENTDGSIQYQQTEDRTGVFNLNLGEFAVTADHNYQEQQLRVKN